MEELVKQGRCWGIIGDTSAASLETEAEAEEAASPSEVSLEDDHLSETLVQYSE